jgi:hypothetical protein
VPLILGGGAARGFALGLKRQAAVVDRIEDVVDTARALVYPPQR